MANKKSIIFKKVWTHFYIWCGSFLPLTFIFILSVIIILYTVEAINYTLMYLIIGGGCILIELIWQVRISKLLWSKEMFVAPCSHSQQEVVYKNAMCVIAYDVYTLESQNKFLDALIFWYLSSAATPSMVFAFQILLFRSPKVGYCPICNEVKVQCPYCKRIMPIEELSNNRFQCLHCGKTNYVH